MNNKAKIYDELSNLSFMFDKEIPPKRLEIYTEELNEFDLNQVIKSIREIRKTAKFFPALSEIIDHVKTGGVPVEEIAVQIANEIIDYVSKFGPYQLEQVKNHLGNKFLIVERFGGWNMLCNITYGEIPSTRAQLRELAKSFLNQAKRDFISQNQLESFENILKLDTFRN